MPWTLIHLALSLAPLLERLRRYSGLIMIAFGIAAVTLSEARLALAALLWWVLEQKVRGLSAWWGGQDGAGLRLSMMTRSSTCGANT